MLSFCIPHHDTALAFQKGHFGTLFDFAARKIALAIRSPIRIQESIQLALSNLNCLVYLMQSDASLNICVSGCGRLCRNSAATSAAGSNSPSPAGKPPTKADETEAGRRMGVSQQEWQVAGDSRPAFSASYRLTPPSSTGIHRGPPAWRAPMDASRRRQVEFTNTE